MNVWQFERDHWLMWFHHEACIRGEKHSVAKEEAVKEYRENFPGARVSITTVSRALATHRPRGRKTVLMGVPRDPSEELQQRFRAVRNEAADMKHRLLGFPMPAPDAAVLRITKVFEVCTGPRPIYPRHNKKDPNARRRR
jgi:hypothetical protein